MAINRWIMDKTEFCLFKKNNEIVIFAGWWLELEIIMSSKPSQTQNINVAYLWSQDFVKKDMKEEGRLF